MRRVPRRILILCAAATFLALGDVVVHAGEADDLRDRAGDLESGVEALEAAEAANVLQLFALESALARSAREVRTLNVRAEQVAEATGSARNQTQIARRALATAEEDLAAHVRALYMSDDVDTLEVILGARTIQDAIDGIGALQRTVSRDEEIVSQVAQARRDAIERRDQLRQRQARVEQLAADATEAREALEQSRSERAAFLRSLREELQLNRGQIVALRERASALEIRAAEIQAEAEASAAAAPEDQGSSRAASPPAEASQDTAPAPAEAAPAPPPSPPSASPPPPSPPASIDRGGGGPRAGSQLTVVSTAYALTGTTAVGVQTRPGIIAVDPNVIPLGTKMFVPGYGEGIAADTGSAVKGAIIDVWVPTVAEALAWGRRTVTITFR